MNERDLCFVRALRSQIQVANRRETVRNCGNRCSEDANSLELVRDFPLFFAKTVI